MCFSSPTNDVRETQPCPSEEARPYPMARSTSAPHSPVCCSDSQVMMADSKETLDEDKDFT